MIILRTEGVDLILAMGGWTWAMLAIALSPFASQGMAECSGLGELGFGLPRSIFNVEHGVHGRHHLNG